jgi:hypothetical protein
MPSPQHLSCNALWLFFLCFCVHFLFAQSLVVSEPECIYKTGATTYKKKYYACDAVSATLRRDNTTMYIFRSTWNATFRFWGPLENAEQHPMFSLNRDLFTIPSGMTITTKWMAGASNFANIYLKNILDLGSGELIGFLHLEYLKGLQGSAFPSCPTCPAYPAIYRIALCYSKNQGETWTFCGDIIGANDAAPGACNIGGAAYVIENDYIYVYFNEKVPNSEHYPSVARALTREVIERARRFDAQASLWHKYNARTGAWDQDAICGIGSRIIGGKSVDMHADAAFCIPLSKYLLAVRDNEKGGLYLYQSINGLNWTADPVRIAADYTDKGVEHQPVFPYFASLTADANADCSSVGKEFFIYYIGQHFADRDKPPRQFTAEDQPVFRVKVQIR